MSIKVAGTSGVTDVGTVIAGIQWAVKNRPNLGIGVLNLSLGAMPTASTALNPLDRAAEVAWNSGIVVVTSAGNAGPFNGTILSPGDDPLVVTVGALDDAGTAAKSDDTMTSFSSVGPTSPDGWFKPDLVAAGRSVISLRAPGSTIDTKYPSARVGTANFVGSGTSFSAAITSGSAALVLQTHAGAAPDTIKGLLLATVAPGPVGNPFVDGRGALNALGAATATGVPVVTQLRTLLTPVPVGATVSLVGTWKRSPWTGTSWSGSAWNGSAWNGTSWTGSAWNGSAWTGTSWTGSAWNGTSWTGTSWTGTSWTGSAWNGTSWTGTSWTGASWNSSSWE